MAAMLTGFYNAPLTKVALLGVGAVSLAASLLEWRPIFGLSLFPHMTQHLQLWRLVTHHLVWTSSSELLLGTIVLYELRLFERRFGSAKFAAFMFMTAILTTLLQIAFLVVSRMIDGPRHLASGPYGLIFALALPYYYSVPTTNTFQVLGFNISYKTFTYLLLAQLMMSNGWQSALAGISGLLAGLLYISDMGGIQRWRFPIWLQNFCERHLLPHVVSSSPYGYGWQQPRTNTGVLATLDGSGRPINQVPQMTAGFRGVGAGDLGMRQPIPMQPQEVYVPPTPEQIASLEVFGFQREQILHAMRRANNDQQRAINILLDEQQHQHQ